MSITLNKFLKSKGYSSVKLIFLETKHYLIEAKVNGIDGTFILDTGASNSCICTSLENKFKVISKESKEKASSATSQMTNTDQEHFLCQQQQYIGHTELIGWAGA